MIVKDLSGLKIERGEIILRVQHPAENGDGHYLDPLALLLFGNFDNHGKFWALRYAPLKPVVRERSWDSPKYSFPKDFTLHGSSGGGGSIPVIADKFYVEKEDVLIGIREQGKEYRGYAAVLEELLVLWDNST